MFSFTLGKEKCVIKIRSIHKLEVYRSY